jgi:hypothetical protein
VCFGCICLVLAVVHNSPGFNLLLQEDGSLPDRDQVRTMFLGFLMVYMLLSLVTSCSFKFEFIFSFVLIFPCRISNLVSIPHDFMDLIMWKTM